MAIQAPAQAQTAPVQSSHINAHAPAADTFDGLLRRDLHAYLVEHGHPKLTKVDHELLRQEPTQSGVAYPKYYAWVRIRQPSGVSMQAAVRLAGVDGQRFEVTHFMSASDIRADPQSVGKVFPVPLVDKILSLAATK